MKRTRPPHASNRAGKTHYAEPEPCPKCGKYDGERKESVNVTGRYFIRCAACGYTVAGGESLPEATKKWNRESQRKQEEKK